MHSLGRITPQPPRPVILDLDMAHEDIFAALFLLMYPNVDLRALTVCGTGEAHSGPGVRNALGLLALCHREEIPVAGGRETPLAGSREFPAAWRQEADDAYGVPLPAGGAPSALSAPDLLIDTLQRAEEPVSVVATGPLTNLGEALQKAPEITRKIQAIYIMGGAVFVPGNVGSSVEGIDNDTAEWNIYIDPAAARVVFECGAPLVLAPVDATRHVPVTRDFYQALAARRRTPAAQLVYDMLTASLDFIDSGGFEFWDSLTAALFTDAGLAKYVEVPISVVEAEGPESGRTLPSASGAPVKVATWVDRQAFERLLLAVWNGEARGEGYSHRG